MRLEKKSRLPQLSEKKRRTEGGEKVKVGYWLRGRSGINYSDAPKLAGEII